MPWLVLLGVLTLLSGCAAHNGREIAGELGGREGFATQRFDAPPFVLFGMLRPGAGSTLRVYIEGDGRAWNTRRQPALDPTPTDPVSLRLAAKDRTGEPVLYLARPCQYVQGEDRRACAMRYWTGARLAEEVIASLDAAITQAKAKTGARTVAVFGYSGGGGAAALLAARRHDVVFLGTVAGNLDHTAWTRHHGVTPLRGSLNPVDMLDSLRSVPQVHWSGGADGIVPPEISRDFCAAVGKTARCVTVPGMTHGGAWETVWEPPVNVR